MTSYLFFITGVTANDMQNLVGFRSLIFLQLFERQDWLRQFQVLCMVVKFCMKLIGTFGGNKKVFKFLIIKNNEYGNVNSRT